MVHDQVRGHIEIAGQFGNVLPRAKAGIDLRVIDRIEPGIGAVVRIVKRKDVDPAERPGQRSGEDLPKTLQPTVTEPVRVSDQLNPVAHASLREYYDFFALTEERLALAAPHAVVMHPGPMNRGVEIDSLVADGERSLILDQVTNGVAVRMAILYLLAGGRGESTADS